MIGEIICLIIVGVWVWRFIAANPEMPMGSMIWGIIWRVLVVCVIYFIVTLIISFILAGAVIGISALSKQNK